MTRRERRAATRQDRYDASRDARRSRAPAGGVSGLFTTRNVTIAAVVIGVVIVAVLAAGQLGGKTTGGTFADPGIEFPAALLHDNTIGSADAPVTLEVYGDFQCPICARHSLTVEPLLVGQYAANRTLRIVHHDIAILSSKADGESERAARGAHCATQQGKYWDYAHWVFNNQSGENQGGFARDRLVAIAGAAGLDQQAFSDCLDTPEAAAAVAATTSQAAGLGINSTPTMAINGTLLTPGLKTADQLGALIEAAAASAAPAPSPGVSGSGASPNTAP